MRVKVAEFARLWSMQVDSNQPGDDKKCAMVVGDLLTVDEGIRVRLVLESGKA